jgi:hypothetical protein
MHHISSQLGYLGMQFAAQKTRPPNLNPGSWAGSIVLADEAGVGVCCTKEKWDKAKGLIINLLESVRTRSQLDQKQLETIRGLMVHIQQMYPAITPYLKGMHLAIDSWRPGKYAEGWKCPNPSPQGFWDDTINSWMNLDHEQVTTPSLVTAVPRLETDLVCLSQLLSAPHPPI